MTYDSDHGEANGIGAVRHWLRITNYGSRIAVKSGNKTARRVSTPGRRVYAGAKELKPHRQGLGLSIVSTPQGVMTDVSARENNVGGEVLCRVF